MKSMSSRDEFVDYYVLLEVEYDASDSELKKSYFRLAKEAHPDAGGSTEHMLALNRAYKTLSNEQKRAAYNKLYSLYNRVALDDLDLKEDDYDTPVSTDSSETGLEDFYVDQVYSEYYEPKKKPGWKAKFKRK